MTTEEKALEMMEHFKSTRPMTILKAFELSEQGMFFILKYLDDNMHREIIAADLAKELSVSGARITTLLKKMENRGWICKYSSAKDARKTVVVLSEQGKRVIHDMYHTRLQSMAKLIEDVGMEDMETFFSILLKVKASIENQGNPYKKY